MSQIVVRSVLPMLRVLSFLTQVLIDNIMPQ